MLILKTIMILRMILRMLLEHSRRIFSPTISSEKPKTLKIIMLLRSGLIFKPGIYACLIVPRIAVLRMTFILIKSVKNEAFNEAFLIKIRPNKFLK